MNLERSPKPIPQPPISLAIVVVNYHCAVEIKRLLESVRRSLSYANQTPHRINLQIWIVNNSLGDRSIQELAKFRDLAINIIDAPGNVGFGRACDIAIAQLWPLKNRPWIWLLNPDTTLDVETLAKLGAVLKQNWETSWAIAGTKVQTPAQKIEFNGGYWNPKTGEILPVTETQQDSNSTAWVSGCSLMFNPKGFGDLIPQFDPDFFLYYEDFELCWRYGKKLRSPTHPSPIVLLPGITITHHTSSIIGRQPTQKMAWAIEGYLLALDKCAPPLVWLRRLIRIAIAAALSRIQGHSGKWIGLMRYCKKRLFKNDHGLN